MSQMGVGMSECLSLGPWGEDELPAVLADLAGAQQPRKFALCEVERAGDKVTDAHIYLWGLDFGRESGGSGPGAVFVSPDGWTGNSDSAEGALECFSLIRDLQLVWL
ncbi:hypothetical protein F1721_32210 [Saccharopolyspora hirsuta]|uniref:Uncharacterized protein n=1 Tax=Saccharopolyspora hirsuta TaxID=1837 RepID=A0A5M7B8D6_SACHI|nr:hypothetical protein [Saccharopolyspora hirsuta]KAA5825826.1 hypothetical protein F1721_32210 [Saccharopolyspora hirsuta]